MNYINQVNKEKIDHYARGTDMFLGQFSYGINYANDVRETLFQDELINQEEKWGRVLVYKHQVKSGVIKNDDSSEKNAIKDETESEIDH